MNMEDLNKGNVTQIPAVIQSTPENDLSSQATAGNSTHAAEGESLEPETTAESSPNKSDSLTDDYVHVDQVPDQESEEVRNLANQPWVFPGYLVQTIPFSMPSVSSFLPSWLYPADTGGGSTTDTETRGDQNNFETWVRETIKGVYTGSLEEETRFRECLVKAISDHFGGMKDADVDFLTQTCGATKEEKHYARESESQCTRRLLLMLLRRDTKTILSFLFGLCTHAKAIVDTILSALNRYLEEGFRKDLYCLRCLLRERVCICLIVDHLPMCDSELLSFVNVVSEENQPARPSVSEKLWDELFKTLTDQNLYEKVIQLLINVLESCEYHSDIVRMLKEDIELQRNSFICRCQEMASCQEMARCQATSSTQQQTQSSLTDPHDVRDVPNEQRVVEMQHDQAVRAEVTDPVAQSSRSHKNVVSTKENETHDDTQNILRGTEYVKRPNGKTENGKLPMLPPKRRQPDREDKVLRKRPPDISIIDEQTTARESSSNKLKRKETSSEHEFDGKRSRNSIENRSPSSFGNCDLQMELLQIGVAGQENGHHSVHSVVSLPSTSSFGDSGVFEQTTMFSRSVDQEETVPKEIAVNNIRPSTLETGEDKTASGELKNETTAESNESVLAADQAEVGDSDQVHLDLNSDINNMEEMVAENSEASLEQYSSSENGTDELSTMTS